MSKPWQNEDRLRELYWDEGMNIEQISDELGCGHTTVWRWMKRLNVERETAKKDRPVHYRTEERGYEVWRYTNGDTQHKVRIHRLASVAWFGFDSVCQKDDVHHKSCIPWDNREDNIELLNKMEHTQIHR